MLLLYNAQRWGRVQQAAERALDTVPLDEPADHKLFFDAAARARRELAKGP